MEQCQHPITLHLYTKLARWFDYGAPSYATQTLISIMLPLWRLTSHHTTSIHKTREVVRLWCAIICNSNINFHHTSIVKIRTSKNYMLISNPNQIIEVAFLRSLVQWPFFAWFDLVPLFQLVIQNSGLMQQSNRNQTFDNWRNGLIYPDRTSQ